MPRVPASPLFPDSSSRWLANFRYRQRDEDGHRLSPESLGVQIGVSGATIRRWESGQTVPTENDLTRFAHACHLSPMQTEFVRRLFSRPYAQNTGVPACFHEEALVLLSAPRPAFILDELFYIRAWNSYFTHFLGPRQSELASGVNLAKFRIDGERLPDLGEEVQWLEPLIRLLWMWTAHLGMAPQYATFVNDLGQNEEFARIWHALVDEVDAATEMPATYPSHRRVQGASHSIYTRDVLFPPLYRVITWEPADEDAERILRDQVSEGPPQIGFADKLHWSVP